MAHARWAWRRCSPAAVRRRCGWRNSPSRCSPRWLVWSMVRRHARSPWVRGAVMVLVLAAMGRGYAVRPQIVTYLGVAALLAWLDRPRRGAPGALTYVALGAGFCLWANAHGAVIAGLGILGLFAALGTVLHDGMRWPHRAALLVCATLAACLTPTDRRCSRTSPTSCASPHPIIEWQPLAFDDPAQRPAVVMLIALAASIACARACSAIAAGGGAPRAGGGHGAAPATPRAAARPVRRGAARRSVRRARLRRRRHAHALAPVGVADRRGRRGIAGAGGRATRLARHATVDAIAPDWCSPPASIPSARCASRARRRLHGNLALPLDWGGYALWHGAPALKVSLDGRFATVYPAAVVEDGFAFFRGDGGDEAARLLDAVPHVAGARPTRHPHAARRPAGVARVVHRRGRRPVRPRRRTGDQPVDRPARRVGVSVTLLIPLAPTAVRRRGRACLTRRGYNPSGRSGRSRSAIDDGRVVAAAPVAAGGAEHRPGEWGAATRH